MNKYPYYGVKYTREKVENGRFAYRKEISHKRDYLIGLFPPH